MVKRCAWGTCNTDSRYPERLIKDGVPVTFHRFPSVTKFKEQRKAWIRACCRADTFVCSKDSYERKGQQKNVLFQRQQVQIRFEIYFIFDYVNEE